MSLPNLVQLVCNEGREAHLRVSSAAKAGEVYFAGGAVVHATAEGLAGEAAFNALAQWPEGDFELDYGVASPARTIYKNWSSLLLAALHSLDERSDARREYYEILLANLATVEGVKEVVVASPDGSAYGASSGAASAREGLLAAFVCAVAARAGEAFGLGDFAQFVSGGEGRPIAVFGFEGECYEFSVANGADPEGVAEALQDLLRMMV